MIHEGISGSIIKAAMEVLNDLRPGLDEKLYENALVIELGENGHSCDQQRVHRVYYKGREIGTAIPDLIIDDVILVDAKVVSEFNATHIAQMLGYLNITGLRLGLLISFKHKELKWRRVVN